MIDYCVGVYGIFGDALSMSLMRLIDIDKREDGGGGERTWKGVRSLFDKKIPEIRVKQEGCMNVDRVQSRLYDVVLNEVVDTTMDR